MFPTIVTIDSDVHLDERTPLWSFGSTDQMHAGFERRAIRLVRVAGNTGTNNVLPGSWSSAIPWNDVIEINVFPVENLATVLTRILVALENIVPRELDLLLRKPVEEREQNDPRHTNSE